MLQDSGLLESVPTGGWQGGLWPRGQQDLRFVVTSLPAQLVPPSLLYTQQYCPRGEMENRFKEQQLELFSDRTSTHTFQGNQRVRFAPGCAIREPGALGCGFLP